MLSAFQGEAVLAGDEFRLVPSAKELGTRSAEDACAADHSLAHCSGDSARMDGKRPY